MFIKFFESILIFLSSIIVARYLGPSDFGKFSYILSIVFIIKPIYNLGSASILQSELSRNKKNISVINQLLSIRLISFLSVSAVAFLVSPLLLKSQSIYLFFILQIAYGFRIFDIYSKALFVYKKGTASVKINFISAIKLLILITISSLFSSSIYIVSLAYLINYLTDILVIILILKKINLFSIFSKLRIDLSNFKKNLLKGLPLMGSSLISIILVRTDVILITNIIDEFNAGIYTAPCRIVIQINILLNLISLNLVPELNNKFSIKNNPKSDKIYIFTWLYSFLFSISFLLLTPILIKFGFGSEYISSIKLIPILSLIVFLNGLTLTDNAFLNFYNFRKIIFLKSISSLLINILLNVILIPLIGLQGALIALLSSSVFNSFGGIIFNKKLRNHYENLIFPNFKILIF